MKTVQRGLTKTKLKLQPVTTVKRELSLKKQLKFALPVPQGSTLVPLDPANVPIVTRVVRPTERRGPLSAPFVLPDRRQIIKLEVALVLCVNLGVLARKMVSFILTCLLSSKVENIFYDELLARTSVGPFK